MNTTSIVVIALLVGAVVRLTAAMNDRRELKRLRRELFLATQILRVFAIEWGEEPDRIREKLLDVIKRHDLGANYFVDNDFNITDMRAHQPHPQQRNTSQHSRQVRRHTS